MAQPILIAENISKSYNDHKALDDVSITVPAGSIYGLLGPNGAGKTTLIRIINQIFKPDAGRVLIAGEPLRPSHVELIGYMPEERGLYRKMKVLPQLVYLGRLRGMSKADALVSIKDWFGRLEISNWENKRVQELSKGMQQKVQFIATVLHRPPLIILDEPFSGFDPLNAAIITREILRLREEGHAVIFSTHRMETVEDLCDHLVIISQSRKVLEGKTDEIMTAYGKHVTTVRHRTPFIYKGTLFTVLRQELQSDGTYQSDIHLTGGLQHENDLLMELMQYTTVMSVHEQKAGMKEIFLRLAK